MSTKIIQPTQSPSVSTTVLSSTDLLKYVIAPYLDNDDKKNLRTCNKQLKVIMKDQILIDLGTKATFKYIFDSDYRALVRSLYNPSQLRLRFTDTKENIGDELYKLSVELLTKHYRGILSLPEFYKQMFEEEDANRIVISMMEVLLSKGKEYNNNQTINSVYEQIYNRLIDVAVLQDVYSLDMSHVPVCNASALGQLREVNLSFTNVSDVSMLGGVHTLNISFTKVRDVSALGRVHTLDLCWTYVSDVSALHGVHTLNVSYTRVRDVSMLINARCIDITDTKVEDTSMLKNCKILCHD